MATAVLTDLLLGEPPTRLHPTVWMGRVIGVGRVSRARARQDHSPTGALLEGGLLLALGGATVAGGAHLVDYLLGRLPGPVRGLARGLALKPALSLRALLAAGHEVESALLAGDLDAARRSLGWHLVSRETAELSAEEVASATIESLTENLCDSFIAPLLAYRAGGLGGAYLCRFINTCDAMLGYRTTELEWFGKPAACVDDVINLIPARLTALLLAAAAPVVGGSISESVRTTLRDAGQTASPNSGWPMAAAAGALGVRLVKPGEYALNRGGREPGPQDLERARRLVRAAALLGVIYVSHH